jgi:hypothetical protein
MLARRFLWIIAAIIVLVIAAAVVYRLFGRELLTAALVPGVSFAASKVEPGPDYRTLAAWDANPGLPADAARWTPPGVAAADHPKAVVFFVTPTAYLSRDRWTMPFDDAATNGRIGLYLRNQASVFNGVGAIWAPKYRQATFGAFLTTKPDAGRVLDLAYGDVVRAFDAFLAAVPPGAPIILAGHSQGSRHLLRLLHERIAGTPLARRVVAVYAVGWSISVTADLPALGFPACATPQATGCVLTWQSFAEPAEAAGFRDVVDREPGLTGASRRGTALLCTNPLVGATTPAAVPAAANHGSLVPGASDGDGGKLVAGGIGAACRHDYLSIGDPPAGFDRYVLPGNNYHVYDYNLFWADVRADAQRRVAAFAAQRAVAASAAR